MSSTASSMDLTPDPPPLPPLRRTLKQKMRTFLPSGSSTGCWSSVGFGPVYCLGCEKENNVVDVDIYANVAHGRLDKKIVPRLRESGHSFCETRAFNLGRLLLTENVESMCHLFKLKT